MPAGSLPWHDAIQPGIAYAYRVRRKPTPCSHAWGLPWCWWRLLVGVGTRSGHGTGIPFCVQGMYALHAWQALLPVWWSGSAAGRVLHTVTAAFRGFVLLLNRLHPSHSLGWKDHPSVCICMAVFCWHKDSRCLRLGYVAAIVPGTYSVCCSSVCHTGTVFLHADSCSCQGLLLPLLVLLAISGTAALAGTLLLALLLWLLLQMKACCGGPVWGRPGILSDRIARGLLSTVWASQPALVAKMSSSSSSSSSCAQHAIAAAGQDGAALCGTWLLQQEPLLLAARCFKQGRLPCGTRSPYAVQRLCLL